MKRQSKDEQKDSIGPEREEESEGLKGKSRTDKGAKKTEKGWPTWKHQDRHPTKGAADLKPSKRSVMRKKIKSSLSQPREVEVTLAMAEGHRLGAQISKEKGVLKGGDLIER